MGYLIRALSPTCFMTTLRSKLPHDPPDPHGYMLYQAIDSLELTEEKINALTDQIPQRPMGVVEGTSYSLVILFAFGVGVSH